MKNSKFKLLFIAIFAIGLSFNADAQSCCKSKSNKKSCHNSISESKEVLKEDTSSADVVSNEADLSKTMTFTVYGNCGMCEKTIEGSLKNVDGVSFADWDKETDIMKVVFDPKIITLDAIKQRIADVGYDSDTHRANDETYNNLPGCCQYERPIT